MARKDIAYFMIRSAAEKGLRDIRENPGRGIRNLVDLGGMFADGRFQRQFFFTAYEELENEDSMYYKLVEKVSAETDADTLLTFGMNLGYNAWTKGAHTIREVERRECFNVPWAIQFYLLGGVYPDCSLLQEIVRQGKELGIYTYLFVVEKAYPDLDALLDLIRSETDCAFGLLLHPAVLQQPFLSALAAVRNVCVSISLDAPPEQVQRAAAALGEHRCLRGGYCTYSDWDGEVEERLSLAHRSGLPFLILLDKKKYRPAKADVDRERLLHLRENLPSIVFPIGLYSDFAHIDCNISTGACLTAIRGGGEVLVSDDQNSFRSTGYLIQNTPLREILKVSMAKSEPNTI